MSHTPDQVDEETADERLEVVGAPLEEARSEEADPGRAVPEEDLPAPEHEKLMWVLAWTMGIIGAIVLIVWTGMLLFLH